MSATFLNALHVISLRLQGQLELLWPLVMTSSNSLQCMAAPRKISLFVPELGEFKDFEIYVRSRDNPDRIINKSSPSPPQIKISS